MHNSKGPKNFKLLEFSEKKKEIYIGLFSFALSIFRITFLGDECLKKKILEGNKKNKDLNNGHIF